VSEYSADDLPLIRLRSNGDRLVGFRMALAQDLYDAGTPPVWGLAKRPTPSERLRFVRVGDRLRVARVRNHWVVSDSMGPLGWLTWRAAKNNMPHPVSGQPIRLPRTGVLQVRTLLISPEGEIKDCGGFVEADSPE
jgi:hypothetical protein